VGGVTGTAGGAAGVAVCWLAPFTTVSPVKGHAEGARGQQVLGTLTPDGPLVPHTMPGLADPSGEHWALLVHPGTAPAAGYVSEKTASYDCSCAYFRQRGH